MPQEPHYGDVQMTASHWREEAERAQAMCTAPGSATREQLTGMSGMDFFSAMMNGEIPPPHMAATGSFVIVSFEFGHVVMQGSPETKFQNTIGSIHGGWIATLLDSALGCAVHTTLSAGRGYATAELKISYLRPISAPFSLVRAEGKVLSVGNKIAFAEGTLFGPDGKKYAHATSTCSVFDAR